MRPTVPQGRCCPQALPPTCYTMVKGRVKVDGDTDNYLNAYRRGGSCRLAPDVDPPVSTSSGVKIHYSEGGGRILREKSGVIPPSSRARWPHSNPFSTVGLSKDV